MADAGRLGLCPIWRPIACRRGDRYPRRVSPSSLEARITDHVEELRTRPYRELEAASAHRRLAWLEQRSHRLRLPGPVSPRHVFEVLFFDKMGLGPEDLPIAFETESEIVWLSRNPCPTLEACSRLGLDTRRVCRAVNEKSTQAFVSWFDPRLRFLRDYQQIRPHASHCKERIVRVDFEAMMRQAVGWARRSRHSGNKGYGAVVALGNDVLAAAHDTACSEGDPSRHAETNAIREAVRRSGTSDLSGAVLFASCEPCPMCASLAVWANLSTVVFGASIEETARLGKARIRVTAAEIARQAPTLMEVIGGVLREDCLELYR